MKKYFLYCLSFFIPVHIIFQIKKVFFPVFTGKIGLPRRAEWCRRWDLRFLFPEFSGSRDSQVGRPHFLRDLKKQKHFTFLIKIYFSKARRQLILNNIRVENLGGYVDFCQWKGVSQYFTVLLHFCFKKILGSIVYPPPLGSPLLCASMKTQR